MSYTKYEFEVLEADSLGGKADLEVWASPEESEHVEVSVTVPGRLHESIGFAPDVAVQLASALDQRAPIEATGLDDYDDRPAELRISWDDEGADLFLVLRNRSVRVVIDHDGQPRRIADALRNCAGVLSRR